MRSNEIAMVEAITEWWSREMEARVRRDGWNAYLVTFIFNHIPGRPVAKLKIMQDSVDISFYSTIITYVVRKPIQFIICTTDRG